MQNSTFSVKGIPYSIRMNLNVDNNIPLERLEADSLFLPISRVPSPFSDPSWQGCSLLFLGFPQYDVQLLPVGTIPKLGAANGLK